MPHQDLPHYSDDEDAAQVQPLYQNPELERDKQMKARERQLNKREKALICLDKQQLDLTEISMQNASLKALVSKLEEKIKTQDDLMHQLKVQVLSQGSGSRPHQMPTQPQRSLPQDIL